MRGERIKIKNVKEIKNRLKVEKEGNTKVRLIFLNLIAYEGVNFKKACEYCGIAESTGYSWIREWNGEGYKGIKKKEGKRGRPSKLSKEGLEKLKEILKQKPYWTTKEVRILIKEKFGIEYSEDQVIRILRDKLRMHFSKPYPIDYRKPENAEALLENQIQLTYRS